MSTPESPELLDERAAQLERAAWDADMEPVRLRMDAARARALAAVMRQRDAAAAALAVAEAAASAATLAHEATAGPEREAAGRSVTARQVFEKAWDTERQAIAGKAEPADLVQARMRATIAAEVAEHEAAAAAEAAAAREAARRALDAARARARQAKETLAAAEDAMSDPLHADLDDATRIDSMFWTWQRRAMLDLLGGADGKLSPADRLACQAWASFFAELLGVGPQAARKAGRAEVAKAYRALRIVGPGGTATTLASIHGGR